MISQQQKGARPKEAEKLSNAGKVNRLEKAKSISADDLPINPKLDKFSGDEFLPAKYKTDESRLANSALPHSSPPRK